MTVWNAEIVEQGNGFPNCGVYVPGDDGELYEVVKLESRINTRHSSAGNWCRARVEWIDWSDVEEDEIFPALALILSNQEKA